MVAVSHVSAEVHCPRCGQKVGELAEFQWGYCPHVQPWDPLFYRLGDEVRWRLDDEDQLRPWVWFADSGGNVGDPWVLDLQVRVFDYPRTDFECPRCGPVAIALRIKEGRLAGFEAPAAEWDLAVVEPSGELRPMPEWDDHPMDLLEVRTKTLATGDGRVIEGKKAM